MLPSGLSTSNPANCLLFYLNRFCREVNNLHVPHNKKGFRQNRTQYAARIGLVKKLKDQSGALHSPLFAILHHKSTELLADFFQPP